LALDENPGEQEISEETKSPNPHVVSGTITPGIGMIGSVQRTRLRNGDYRLPLPKYARNRDMANLKDRGYTLKRIGEQYGIHFTTVSKKIKQVRDYDADQSEMKSAHQLRDR